MKSEVIDLPTPKILKFKLEKDILDHLSKLSDKYDDGKPVSYTHLRAHET